MTTEVDAAPGELLWWHLGAVAASAVALAVVALSTPGARPVVVAGALVVFLACWWAFGRHALDGRPGWAVFTAVIVAVALVGATAHPAFAIWQSVAFPLVWTLAPDVRRAVPANIAVALAVGVGYAVSTGAPVEAAVVEGLSLGFSLVMGVWITRIARLSEERRLLAERLQHAQQEAAALSREAGISAERERLARELHDTIAQSLAGVVMLAERAAGRHPDDPDLPLLEEAARSALTETRTLVAAGAPVPLDGGLAAAVATLATRFERETGVAVAATVEADVPRELEVVLLRCAQEGLANIRKHAAARAVVLTIAATDGDVELALTDDGVGLPDDAGERGFGVAGMRDRVGLVGGTVGLTSGPRGGTSLRVRIPLSARAAVP
ncbi:sensor histidine kinase [Amnibacterium sp. CER49]|uniref:sensor histidine kinase n=1 Tax=Amnibacterium sp. CER49 TaxID=3039161 RepID=UPI00244A66EC|nr:sensor histidine kinase [Amnibacterium sp. CER49]MDH2442636.1 sensor histidine kinase [Amnibacterium sp. CER49]